MLESNAVYESGGGRQDYLFILDVGVEYFDGWVEVIRKRFSNSRVFSEV